MLGFGALMRRSEFLQCWDGYPPLTLGQVELRESEAYITIDHSKTNQFARPEVINCPCHCTHRTKKLFGNVRITADICPFHTLQRYITLRNEHFGSDPSEPLLLKDNGHVLNSKNLSAYMRRVICAINKSLNFQLNPDHYPPHSLRVGGATDLARSGFASHTIQSQGRWLTDLWKTTYLSNDFRDIALLSALTEMELKEQCRY
jgi:hypothetical protein